MALPAGIDFRATSGYVTDPANVDYEIGTTANYPRTTAQGISVGWESSGPDAARDRSATNNASGRLAGLHSRTNTNGQLSYRIDLPATGSYSVNLAAGDPSYAQTCKVEFFDTTTSLGVVCNGSTGGSNKFFDASGNIWTNLTWLASNVPASLSFATTIFRVKIGGAASGATTLNHVFITSAGGSNKTLAADAGSYALTGSTASALVKRIVVAAAGAYALTGTAASLKHGFAVPAGVGAYNLTGTAASVLHGWRLNAAAGAYVFTGTDATLSKTSGKTVAAGVGSYALTGTAATLSHAWLLGAGAGAYNLTGTSATLTKTKTFPAGAGSYALAGTAATLLQVRKLIAGSGIYLLSGSAVTLTNGPQAPSDAGQTILMPGKAGPTGSAFTRRRYQEFMAAERAVQAAELRAKELKTSKQKASLKKAAQAAQTAIDAARESDGDLAQITASLEAAASATKAKLMIEQANAAYKAAKAVMDDLEDEEEAIMLLLH